MGTNRKFTKVTLNAQPRMFKSYAATVNATSTLATIIGEALPANVAAVEIYVLSDTTLRVQNNAAADADSGGIQQYDRIILYGDKTELDLIQLYTGGENLISFFVYTF